MSALLLEVWMCIAPSLTSRFESLHRTRVHALDLALRRRFPAVCSGRIEDAISAAFAEVCASPRLLGLMFSAPEDEVHRLLLRIAWCQLRGQCRRRAYRRELGTDALDELSVPAFGETPEEAFRSVELEGQIRRLVTEAAARVGGRRKEDLEAALLDRIFLDVSDTEAAERHELPREYVNRGKRVIQEALC